MPHVGFPALPYWVWKCIVGTVHGFALLGSQIFMYKHWERQERERGGGCERDVGRERGLGGGCLILYLTQGLKNVQKEREEEEERGWHFPCWPFVMSSGPRGLGRAGLHREHNHRAGPRVSSHTNTLDGTRANTHTRTTSTCYGHSLKPNGSPECRSAKWGFSVLTHSALTTEQMSNAGDFAILWQITALSYAHLRETKTYSFENI